MKSNPMGSLPASLLEETYQTGPYLGRTVHKVSGPSEIKSIMQDHFPDWHKSPLIMKMLSPILGRAILTAHDQDWREQRKILQPVFFKKRLNKYIPDILSAADESATMLSSVKSTPDIHQLMNDTTFSVIERVIFSDSAQLDRAQVRSAIDTLLEEIGTLRLSDLVPAPGWLPRYMTSRARRALKLFRESAQREIDYRRKHQVAGEDLLGLLLTVQSKPHPHGLSDTLIRDTLMTFIAAGHETTALALTWSLYLLSHDQVSQDKVRREARLARAKPDSSHIDPEALVFTRQVIEEALRLYPPAPILGRQAVRDTHILDHPVKKGDVVLMAFYALHRHRTLWKFPEYFDPDRWSEETRPRDRYQFMAFGGGPRACLGSQLAMLEASIILSCLVRDLRFEPVPDHSVEPLMQVTLRPRGGLNLRAIPVRASESVNSETA